MKKNWIVLIGAVVLATALTSCTSTRITDKWKDDSFSTRPLGKVLVLGISENESTRRSFEDRIAEHLGKAGVTVVASHRKIDADDKLTKKEYLAVIKEQGVDTLMTTHMVAIDAETRWNPPTAMPNHYYGGWGYYSMVSTYAYAPGYYSNHETVRLETNLYDAKNDKLVWTAQSATFDPSSSKKLIDSLAKALIKQLRRDGVL